MILARNGAPQISEIAQQGYKIGEKNVFLQGLQQLERKTIESNEKEQSQTNTVRFTFININNHLSIYLNCF